jgi:hypothetical protein
MEAEREAERVEKEREKAQREGERAEWEVLRAQRVAEVQRMQDMFSFMSSLGTTLSGVVVPQSLLAPVVPSTPLALGTPVSIYIWLIKSFSLCRY